MANTLGELAREGRGVRVWCNLCGRPSVLLDPLTLAATLGMDRPVYGVWRFLRCSACGASGRERGALYSMPERKLVPQGLGGVPR